jgi:hypothetical protein
VVLCIDLACLAEASHHLHGSGCRGPAGTEQLGGLLLFQAVVLIVRAPFTVVPADLPVLFAIFDDRFTGFKHEGKGGQAWIIDLFIFTPVILKAGQGIRDHQNRTGADPGKK